MGNGRLRRPLQGTLKVGGGSTAPIPPSREVGIAFDGDTVLFSNEAACVYQEQGLAAFQDHEERRALHRLRADSANCQMKIRTALVTTRSAPPLTNARSAP